MKDFLGNEIKVGSKVAYPMRYGSSMWMVVGIVKEITKRKDWYDRTIPALKVEHFKASDQFEDEHRKGKTATLTALDRILVVGEAQ